MGENQGSVKKHIVKVMILVVALIVLSVSASFAYYTANTNGEAKETIFKAANLEILSNLDRTAAIKSENMQLIDPSEKEARANIVSFYIESTSKSTVDASYNVFFKDISITKNLYSKYLKWELLRNDTIISSGTFEDVIRTSASSDSEAYNVATSAQDIQLNNTALILNKGTTDNLIFRIWLEDDKDKNQISVTEGKLYGKLYLEAVPISENQ